MTRCSRRALRASLLALPFVLALTSCADDTVVAPLAPDDDSPKATVDLDPIVPQAAPANSTTSFVSSDRCALPLGERGAYVRSLSTLVSGSHPLTAEAGWNSCSSAPDDAANWFAFTIDGAGFSWTSTVGVGGVVLWSGDHGLLYNYNVRSGGESGLSGPVDPDTGEVLPIDGITVCYDYQLGVVSTLETTGGAGATWSMTAEVSPSVWELRRGDRATSRATIDLQRSDEESGTPHVTATVEIRNDTPLTTQVMAVFAYVGNGYAPASLSQPAPVTLEPGASLTAVFERDLPTTDPAIFSVFVRTDGVLIAPSQERSITFDTAASEVELVTDDGRRLGPFDDSTQVTIERVFTADTPGTHQVDWTVEIDGATDTPTALPVMVSVHEPFVDVAVTPRFTRHWNWDVDVVSTEPQLAHPFGPLVAVRGRAVPTVGVDEGFGVAGRVLVTNPHATDALGPEAVVLDVDGVRRDLDVGSIPPAGQAAVDVDLPLSGPAGAAVVAVTWTAREFAADRTWDPLGPQSVTQRVRLDFSEPTAVVDGLATVRESNTGDLAVVAATNGPTVVEAIVGLDPATPCGPATLAGHLALRTDDSGEIARTDYSVELDLPCEESSCVRTARYWRRHPEDPAWARLEVGPQTPLFDSPYSWMSVLRPSIRGGMYKQLAMQYVGARLNGLAGADLSAVEDELVMAADMLRQHDARSLRGREAWRAARLAWALRRYNAGKIGPERCED